MLVDGWPENPAEWLPDAGAGAPARGPQPEGAAPAPGPRLADALQYPEPQDAPPAWMDAYERQRRHHRGLRAGRLAPAAQEDVLKTNADLVRVRPPCTGREKCVACGVTLCSAPFMYPPFFVGQMLERCKCCGAYQPPHPRAEVKPKINAHLL